MKPTLVVNPADDHVFGAIAEDLFTNGAQTPAQLVEGLRSRYPRVVVHVRELANESFDVWYVYRDGHWIASTLDGNGG
jgi:hypothetical protein